MSRVFGINIKNGRLHKSDCCSYPEADSVNEGRTMDMVLANYNKKDAKPCKRCLKNNKEAEEKCKKHNKK